MLRYITLCLFLTVNLYDQIEADAVKFYRNDYTFNGDFSSFYKIHTIGRSWADARLRCKREGSEIFVPETQAEAQYVAEVMKEKLNNTDYVWIGITDIVSEGDYQTVNGKFLDEVYINWQPNEPNDASGVENCLIMTKSAQMNDDGCQKKAPFVCKKTQSTVEWNALCDMADTNYVFNGELGKCYKFHLRPLNWTTAQSVCIAEQSYLAVINSQKEADYLVKLTADAPKNYKGPYLAGAVLLGFHNHFGEGYTTVHGIPLDETGYTSWGGGQPDNSDTEFCGSMFYNGGLNDMNCISVCYFICEHDIGKPLDESGYTIWGEGQPDHSDTNICGSMFYNGGLNDVNCSSVCYFVCEHDCIPLEETGYIKWGGGQPDQPDVELCGSMFYNGGLNDMRCSNVCYFICEHDIGSLNSNLDERFGV